MSLPRILLIGSSKVGKHDLLGSIREQSSARNPEDAYPWRLDNKYYTADVQIDVRHVDQCGELQLGDGAYEAVVLVFDAEQQSSFAAVQRWYEAAGGGDVDLGVRLAVGTRADSVAVHAAWLQEAEEWCAEQLVELVDMAEEQQEEAGGATGVRRVCEALSAHMWPGMQLKPEPRRGGPLQVPDAVQQQAEAEVEEAVQAAAAAIAANASSSSSSATAVRPQQPAEAVAAAAANGHAADEEEGEEVEQLEQLFAQVASHRAQLAQLPDAQRREAAAAMVMQLMAAMGLEGEDDEEEDEEEAAVPA